MRIGLATVRGLSMLPTLRDGDTLLVAYDARFAPPRPGRLAIVRLPPDEHGESRPIAVKRLDHRVRTTDGTPGWWVERDNPMVGTDSWVFGPLPEKAVAGVVLARLPRRPRWLSRRPG